MKVLLLGDVIYIDFKGREQDHSTIQYETEIIDIEHFRRLRAVILESRLEKELDNFFSNNMKELSDLCEKVFRLNPHSPVALSSIALKKYLMKAHDIAMTYVYRALDSEPENKYAMLAMMSFFGEPPKEGYFSNDEMFDFAMKADKAHPKDPEVLEHLLSLSIYKFRDVEMAEMYYKRGVALNPVRFGLYEGPVNMLKKSMNG